MEIFTKFIKENNIKKDERKLRSLFYKAERKLYNFGKPLGKEDLKDLPDSYHAGGQDIGKSLIK